MSLQLFLFRAAFDLAVGWQPQLPDVVAGETGGKTDALEGCTAGKGTVTDTFHAVRDCDFFQRGTAAECLTADQYEGIRQFDLPHGGTLLKRLTADPGEPRRQLNIIQLIAAEESQIANDFDRIRDRDIFQR